jgi:hypothetical protein
MPADATLNKTTGLFGRWEFDIKVNRVGYVNLQIKDGAISTGKYYIFGQAYRMLV